MKFKLGLIFSLFIIFQISNCTNLESTTSCKNSCNDKQNLCLVAMIGSSSYASSSFLGCEIYKSSCYSSCTKSSSKTSNRSSSSSRSSGSRSSSSGSRSSGGGSGVSSGGGSSGSGGSSHSILANSDTDMQSEN
ncbi:MAG: hypothetical protein KBF93_01460 [Leptospiraceae bacterium]|nr:hypothetical protein [Leptospiraceae bacterium]